MIKVNVKCEEEIETLRIGIPSGKTMETNRLAKGVSILIEKKTLEVCGNGQ